MSTANEHQVTADSSVGGAGAAPNGASDAGSIPTRVCPHCAAMSQTGGEFCPFCGGRFADQAKRSRYSTRVKVVGGCVLALLVLGGAGVAVAIKVHHDDQVAAQHQRAAAAAKQRQQQQQAQQQQQQAQQQAEIAQRQSLETQLESAITKDATDKANSGLLSSGSAQSTTCTPVNGGSSQNLSQASGTYSCIAVYQTSSSDGTQSGYSYTGTINFNTGAMTWQLGSHGG